MSNDQMRAHRRQFVLGHEPVLVDEDWASVGICKGLHLSYHQALPITETRDRDGGSWWLLGIALQADPLKGTPRDEIATAHGHEIEALTSTWSGRWILVGGGVLRTDAGGLFGCFYGRSQDDGQLLVSSSAALIRDQIDAGEISPALRYEMGMDWYPPPASRLRASHRLLPSQILALSDDDRPVLHRSLVGDRFETAYDETLAGLETSIRTVLGNLAEMGRPLWLALTGGHDSRVLLAALWRESSTSPPLPSKSRECQRPIESSHRFSRKTLVSHTG